LQISNHNKMKYIFFILLSFILYSSYAQEAEIKGNIYDFETGKPLNAVKVSVPSLGLISVSDTSGTFYIKGALGEQVEIIFEKPDYEIFTSNVTIMQGIVNDYIIYLKKKLTINLPLVIIKDSHKIPKAEPIYPSHISYAADFENTAVRDIGDLLRTLPNVSGIRKGGANIDPVIRGFKYSQINVVINGAQGVEGGCPNRMDPTTSRIDAEEIESIEVLKGPYALSYGASLGGTLNLVSRYPKPQDSLGVNVKALRAYESNWNGHKEHLSVGGGNKNAFVLLSGNRWNYGNYTDGNRDLVKAKFSKQNYAAKIGGDYLNKYHFLFGISQSSHKVLFPALPMDETNDNSTLTYTEYTYKPDKDFLKIITVKGYLSYVHHIMDNKNRPTSDTVVAISDVKAFTEGIKAQSTMMLCKGLLHAGIDYQKREKYGSRFKHMIMQPMLPVKTEQLWNNANIENTALFLTYSKQSNSFEYMLAGRYDYNKAWSDSIKLMGTPGITLLNNVNTASSFNNYSFSGGITKHFSENLSLGLNAGRVSRSPDMLERFIILLPVGYDFYDYLGNPQLKPETNNQIDLIFKYQHNLWGGIELNLFGAYVQDFIYGKILPPAEQMPLTQYVKGVKRFENGPVVNMGGFEFAYATPQAYDLKINLSAAFTYATVSESTKHIINQSENYKLTIKNDALNEIPPFESNINVAYALLNGRLTPSVSARVVASQNHVSEAFFEEATPGFTLFNCALNVKLNKYLTFNAGINNILNVAYYEHLNRRVANSIQKLYEPGRIVHANMIINF